MSWKELTRSLIPVHWGRSRSLRPPRRTGEVARRRGDGLAVALCRSAAAVGQQSE